MNSLRYRRLFTLRKSVHSLACISLAFTSGSFQCCDRHTEAVYPTFDHGNETYRGKVDADPLITELLLQGEDYEA